MTLDGATESTRIALGVAGALVITTLLVLAVVHVLALRGRRLLPAAVTGIGGWFAVGIGLGLATLITAGDGFSLVLVGLIVAWMVRWGWREGRLASVGLVFVGGSIPWLLAGPVLGLEPAWLLLLVGGVLVAVGVALRVVPTRPRRPAAGLDRARILVRTIEQAQAMGPVPAPPSIGFILGLAASSLVLFLGRDLDIGPRSVLSAIAFVVVGIGVWYVSIPPRVGQAYDVLMWQAGVERRRWHERIGRPLPLTPTGMGRLLDELPHVPHVRPLRIELLASFGRTDEARDELASLEPYGVEAEAEAADLAAHIAWSEGRTDEAALDRLSDLAAQVDDREARLRVRAGLALARTRQRILGGDPNAIDELAAIQPQLGSRAWAFAIPYAWGIVLTFVAIGVLSAVLGLAAGAA